MEYTRIPEIELNILKQLKGIKVVFDVGTRTDIDYFEIFPQAEFHLFEPHPDFFKELKEKVEKLGKQNVYLNNYGLGNTEGEFAYQDGIQAFEKGEASFTTENRRLPIKTLDWYIKENNIKKIDFLKIDTEGYDYNVLLGGIEAIKITRYILYEHWNNRWQFHELLNNEFWMKYIGGRNVLCRR